MAGSSPALLLVATFMLLLRGSLATNFEVGGPWGWAIPPAPQPTFYNDWADSNIPFVTGDTLDFSYATGDSVLRVTKDDYNTCNTMHPIDAWTDGPHPFPLNGFSIIYFISGAPGHCAAGQKMIVTHITGIATDPPWLNLHYLVCYTGNDDVHVTTSTLPEPDPSFMRESSFLLLWYTGTVTGRPKITCIQTF